VQSDRALYLVSGGPFHEVDARRWWEVDVGDEVKTVQAYLATVRGAEVPAAAVTETQLLQWRAEEISGHRAANARRYLLGRALAARRAQIERGQVEDWQAEVGARFGLSLRSLRLYVQIATDLDEAITAADEAATPLNGTPSG